jgi:glutamate-1-semialdehyde aminotransferase
MYNYSKSNSLLEKAKELIPVTTQTFSKSYKYFPYGASPLFIDKAKNAHVWDVDGNEFVDFIMGLCPITLGWKYPAVDKAIKRQLKKGIIFSLPSPLEVELSELLTNVLPNTEMVRFFKTGSEATTAAIRIARAYTGRQVIASSGSYHGWHDWWTVTTDRKKGVPEIEGSLIRRFPYNDLDALEKILKAGNIAAVIMEPWFNEKPNINFLDEVKRVTHENGALLIFDEIVTGFRFPGFSAQDYFKVEGDLSTFGKGMANGMPLCCVTGPTDIMKEFELTHISSTFAGETLSLAAGIATIKEMKDKDTINWCWNLGTILMDGINDDCNGKIGGYPGRVIFKLPKDTPEVKTLFMQEMIKRGILLHSSFAVNICYTHTVKDINKFIDAFHESMNIVKIAIDEETVVDNIHCDLINPSFKRL